MALRARRSGGPRRRRPWRFFALGSAAALLAVIVLLFVGPRYAARYFVANELDRLGVKYDGIQTIDVNLWAHEIRFGPFNLRMAKGAPARIAHFGVKLDLRNLLTQRAIVEFLTIDGVDVSVHRSASGAISVNGIDVFAPGEGAAPAGEATATSWQAGLDDVRLRDSVVRFTEAGGGEAEIHVDRLTLRGFRSWQPDAAGQFDLKGSVNGVSLTAQGKARPFADRIQADGKITIGGGEISKVERFLGSLGLARDKAVLSSELTFDVALLGSGDIDATVGGWVDVSDADLAMEDVGAVTAEKLRIDLDGAATLKGNALRVDPKRLAVALDAAKFQLGDTAAQVERVALEAPDAEIRLAPDGMLSVHGTPRLVLKAPAATAPQRVAAEALSAKFATFALTRKGTELTIRGEGRIQAVAVKMPDALSLDDATVDLSGLALSQDGDGLTLRTDGSLKASALAVPDTASLRDVSLNLSDFALSQEGETLSIHTDGTLDATGVTTAEKASLGRVSLDLNGLALSRDGQETTLATAGTAKAEAVSAQADGPLPLGMKVGRAEIAIEGIKAALGKAGVRWRFTGGLRAEDVAADASGGDAGTAKIRALEMSGIDARDSGAVSIGQIQAGGLEASLTDAVLKPPAQPAETQSEGETLKIGRAQLTDPARLHFIDNSFSPPVETDAVVETLSVTDIDTADPAARSAVELAATLNEFTHAKLKGWVSPGGKAMDFDLQSSVTGADLARYSPYAARAIGMHVDSGQLDVTATAKARRSALDALVKLTVKDLDFKALSAEDAKRFSGATGVPAETAVGLLQDSDKVIDLTIPVHGTVEDPQFDLSEAIGKAVGNALVDIFPPTALASLVLSVGDSISGITFKPLRFEPGSAVLETRTLGQLANLKKLLESRPKLSLRVCGRATSGDFENYVAMALARYRAEQAAAAKAAQPQAAPGAAPAEPPRSLPKAPPPPPRRTALLAEAEPEMAKLALARTRAVRSWIAQNAPDLAGRVSECRSVADASDKARPQAKVTF